MEKSTTIEKLAEKIFIALLQSYDYPPKLGEDQVSFLADKSLKFAQAYFDAIKKPVK